MAYRVELQGRVIKAGRAEGLAMVSPEAIGFLGGVDPETGNVIEAGHAVHSRPRARLSYR